MAAVATSACSTSPSRDGSPKTNAGATLVFATSGEPRGLDPALSGNIVELQFATLLFETLVRVRPGGTAIEPGLATAWHPGADGTSWTFSLRRGARFHDGTAFDGAAVCANFERWYRFSGLLQSPAVSGGWQSVFGGFAKHEGPAAPPRESLYRSCEAPSEHEAVINLTRPSGLVIGALALPAFSIASPDALKRYEADRVSGAGNNPQFEGTFASEHPIGTGPFKFDGWTRQQRLVLVRNDDYWGDKPKVARVIVPSIADPTARRQALESGEIDGYDVVAPADLAGLDRSGFKILRRPAFNVGLIGLNRALPPLDKLEIRQAVAHAIDRKGLVKAKYPPGTQVADQFLPPVLWGRASKITDYSYGPDVARNLITRSGLASPTVELWYRPDYTSPIVVDPEGLALALKADLERAGFVVQLKAVTRAEYAEARLGGRLQIWIDERYGAWGDPDSFLRAFADHPEVYGLPKDDTLSLVDRAAEAADHGLRSRLYGQLNQAFADDLPAVPFVHVPVYLATTSQVGGIVAGPLPWDFSFMRTATK